MTYYRRSRPDGITIAVDYGYDVQSITVSEAEWRRICAGKPVSMTGHGFHCEGIQEPDYWQINVQYPGRIVVHCASGFDVFSGRMSDGEVLITDRDGRRLEAAALHAESTVEEFPSDRPAGGDR